MRQNSTSTHEVKLEKITARNFDYSLVISCYKVEKYIPDFLQSLDNQQKTIKSKIQLIFVIDGCPENTEEVIKSWAESKTWNVLILKQSNQGVASARNLGLKYVKASWVTFPDPDDTLDSNYLHSIDIAREKFPTSKLFAAYPKVISPDGNHIEHPLEFKFNENQTREIDLLNEPDYIQTVGGVVFYKTAEIATNRLTFDTTLPQASDTYFIQQFLLLNEPKYILVPEAIYNYQRRDDGSSIVQQNQNNVARHLVLFKEVDKSLIELSNDNVPQWLANQILYWVYFLFRRNLQEDSAVYETDPSLLKEISTALKQNLKKITPEKINKFKLFDVPAETRAAWLFASSNDYDASPLLHLEYNIPADTRRVAFFSREQHKFKDLEIFNGNAKIKNFKLRSVEFLGEHWCYQNIISWTPSKARAVKLKVLNNGPELLFDGESFSQVSIRRKQQIIKPEALRFNNSSQRTPSPEQIDFQEEPRTFNFLSKSREKVIKDKVWVFSTSSQIPSSKLLSLAAAISATYSNTVFIVPVKHYLKYRLKHPKIHFIPEATKSHLEVMKKCEILFSDSLDADIRSPFPRSVLPKTWFYAYIPEIKLAKSAYRTINPLQIDLIIVESAAEGQILKKKASNYRFFKTEVIEMQNVRSNPQKLHADKLISLIKTNLLP